MLYGGCIIRKCTVEDVDDIMELQRQIISEIDDKEILRENNREMFITCVQTPNFSLGVFNEDKELIAIAIFCDARGTDEDISKCLVKHNVDVAANFKLILVRKDYRGRGLQKSLMWILEKCAANCGYTHLCMTASPKNIYSISNSESMGYAYDHSEEKYGGLLRNIYVKNIASSVKKYNEIVIQSACSLEGLQENKELVLEGIELNKCIRGDVELANTGDVLVYEDRDSGEIYYGLFIKKFVPMVVIYSREKCVLQVKEYDKKIESMILKYALLNTVRGV